jgi:cellulose biosynthesis protein BcsQ
MNEISKTSQSIPKIFCFYPENTSIPTISLTLAISLAQDGHRVLLYDCDSQISLTSIAYNCNEKGTGNDKLDKFKNLPTNNIPKSLYDQVIGKGRLRSALAIQNKCGIFIVKGDRRLVELDETILKAESYTHELKGQLPNNISARPYHAILTTAQNYKVDFVFLTLSAYPTILNRCLVMSSNFIISCVDLNERGVENFHYVDENLNIWRQTIKTIQKLTDIDESNMHWAKHQPKFLGFIEVVTTKQSCAEFVSTTKLQNQLLLEAQKLTKNLNNQQKLGTIHLYSDRFRDCVPLISLDFLSKFEVLFSSSNSNFTICDQVVNLMIEMKEIKKNILTRFNVQ